MGLVNFYHWIGPFVSTWAADRVEDNVSDVTVRGHFRRHGHLNIQRDQSSDQS